MTNKKPTVRELNEVRNVYREQIERIVTEKRYEINREMPDPTSEELMSPFIEKLKEALPNAVIEFDGFYFRKCDREYCVKVKCWIKPAQVDNTTAELKQTKLDELKTWEAKKHEDLKDWYIRAVEARILPDAEIQAFDLECII